MGKQENSQIVETAKEARGAELGPTVRNVLVWSLGLVVAAFAVTYFMFFRPKFFPAFLHQLKGRLPFRVDY
jgi:hypothetical protein